jgi:hypothetical protein
MLIIVILCIICFFIYYYYACELFNNDTIENFDETKIKTNEMAQRLINEYNYEKYKPYIDKYFKPIDIIDLNKISVNHDKRIFCSVASYRDMQCPLTVKSMIDNARNPERLVICICQQNDASDKDCFEGYPLKGATIIKIILSDRDARGPCWARYLIQQQWTGEEYFLQIDSHMRFVKDWDNKCISQLDILPEKSCLTNYVSNFDLKSGEPDNVNPLRGPLRINNKETSNVDGFFRVNSDYIKSADKPMLAYGWGACFSFSKSNLLHDAPYDPYTPFLFFGEEMDIWARMYTHGWHVYAPSMPICFTNFDRSYRPTFWENPDQQSTEYLCRLRLYYRFGYLSDIPDGLKIGLEKYNLGKEKTWTQFLTFCLDEQE